MLTRLFQPVRFSYLSASNFAFKYNAPLYLEGSWLVVVLYVECPLIHFITKSAHTLLFIFVY